MTELEQLTRLCSQLGAQPHQAAAMAGQLIKRADQLSAERGISRVEAMAHLLDVLVKGSRGETPAGFEGVKTRVAPKPAANGESS